MNYANWPTRAGAYLIDGLIASPFFLLARIFEPTVDPTTGATSGNQALFVLFFLPGVLLVGYNRWYLGGKTGRSWGKKALGVSLLRESTGQPIGMGKAFLRDLAHVADTLTCYIGWLFPLWDTKRQTFADKIVKTVVVKG
ncbi:RDD family protein [Micromonospora sp. IBSANI012]|uniref:RDD family protein n=1 Tax=Micromonospora sp. IBSANI012 TaxID=3457761 RepID=UPI00405A07A0